jgi:hypothetical protein
MNTGGLLPAWYDTADATAVHGTARVRTVNPSWLIARDRRQNAYCLLGPGPTGWEPMQWVTDDQGRYLAAGEIDWNALVAALWRGRIKGEDAVSRVHAHNERLRLAREKAMAEEAQEKLKYCHGAIQREVHGDGRFTGEDLAKGLKARWV